MTTYDTCPICLESSLHRWLNENDVLTRESCNNPKCGYYHNYAPLLPAKTHDENGMPTPQQMAKDIEQFLCGE